MQTMYRAKAKSLPDCVQSLFSIHECKYEFTVQKAKKGIKRRCISVVGVQFWNNCEMDVRMVNSFLVFTGFLKKSFIESYKCN